MSLQPDAAEVMRKRLQTDLRVALKARLALDVAVLRVLIAALDNAGAVPVAPEGLAPRHEVERRQIGFPEVQSILWREYEAHRTAAEEFARLGRDEDSGRARREMAVVSHYLSVPTQRSGEHG